MDIFLIDMHIPSHCTRLKWSSDDIRHEMDSDLCGARGLEDHPPETPHGNDDALTRTCVEGRNRGEKIDVEMIWPDPDFGRIYKT
jgi:hypothetical protein